MYTTHAKVRALFAAAVLSAVLATPARADVGAPVAFGLGSGDPLRPGQPVTVHVVIRPAADFPVAHFRVATSPSWTVLDTAAFWTGALKANQEVTFTFRAIPVNGQPEPLRAVLDIPGFPPHTAKLDPERLGGRFPERVIDETRRDSRSEPEIHPVFEPGAFLPEPENATEPTIPGQAPKTKLLKPDLRNKAQRNAGPFENIPVRATGRFTYLDNNDVRQGVRFATVELVNAAIGMEPFDLVCATSLTDSNGNFDISVPDCDDLTDGPDVRVRLVLNNNRVEVKPDGLFTGSYTFQTSTRSNVGAGTQNFGTITLSGTNLRRAAQTHNIIMRAQRFIADQGENMSKVTVFMLVDGDHSFYTPVLNEIHIQPSDPFGEEGDIFHEYAHHILASKAESPASSYDNGICDDPSPSHCIDQPENGTVAWTEGWPNFFAMYMLFAYDATDKYEITPKYDFELFEPAEGFEDQAEQIEGVTAAVLWDLVDSVATAGENDPADLTFANLWNVIKNFDPSGNLFHNHPTSLDELYEGLREMYFSHINDVAAVYEEYHVNAPQPDLRVTSLADPPSSLQRGVAFTLNNTIRNMGDEVTARTVTVRFQLTPAFVTARQLAILDLDVNASETVTIGSRNVASGLGFSVAGFDTGSESSSNTSLMMPASAAKGFYKLRVCVDANNSVAESSEANNCVTPFQTITVR